MEHRPDQSTSLDLTAARRGGPVLVQALSGMGKSTLAARYPGAVLDADAFLYSAVAMGFPTLEPRARLWAWRDLCRRQPWELGGDDLDLWARVRRAWFEPFVAALRSDKRLIVTSLRDPPGLVAVYYGIERGRYLEHLTRAGRASDNHHSEAMNDRLEGYAPLIRMHAGTFLADRPEICALLSAP